MRNFGIELKWGLIFTAAGLLWSLIEKLTGLHDEHIEKHMIYTNIFAVVAIAIFVFALKDKKQNFYGGEMTWSQGFISGLAISVVVAMLTPLSMYLTFGYMSPNYFENVIELTVSKGIHSREVAEKYFNLEGYILQGIFSGLSMGVVTSAIVALFVKSNKKVA